MDDSSPALVELKALDTSNHVVKLHIGRHVIGRGPLLGCVDKRISRNHGVIEISADGTIELESTHLNPCFHQKKGNDKCVAVSKTSKVTLEAGDKFSLLPSSCSYEVIVHRRSEQLSDDDDEAATQKVDLDVDTQSEKVNSQTGNGIVERKRVLPQWLQDFAEANGVAKSDEMQPGTSRTNVKLETTKNKDRKSNGTPKTQTRDKYNDQMSDEDEMEETAAPPVKKTREKENVVKKTKEKEPMTSNSATPSQKRKKCSFGATCYRKNPAHFEEECHPGDDDYVSDEEVNPDDDDDDSRPECEYGIKCYRKNPQHRIDYKHTKDPRPVRAAAKKAKAKTKAIGDDDSDDSFIVDDDSDLSFASSESSEDVAALVKEAEKFKRNKKLLKQP